MRRKQTILDTPNNIWRLRWRFEYLNRPAKYGQWSRPADRMEDMACFQNHEGKLFAAIEAKNVVTCEIKRVVECNGEDFVNFQWNAISQSPVGGSGLGSHQLVGLKLVTREEEISVFQDGTLKTEKRTEQDKRFHYKTFGR